MFKITTSETRVQENTKGRESLVVVVIL